MVVIILMIPLILVVKLGVRHIGVPKLVRVLLVGAVLGIRLVNLTLWLVFPHEARRKRLQVKMGVMMHHLLVQGFKLL
jgi:UPF0716 family protein affecting phage T7 exclusion